MEFLVQSITSALPGPYVQTVFFGYLWYLTRRTVPWGYGSIVFNTLESHTNRMKPVMAEVALGIWLVGIVVKTGDQTVQ